VVEDVGPAAVGRPGQEVIGARHDEGVRSLDDAGDGGGTEELDVVEAVTDRQHRARVESVEPGDVVPVYNLDVATNQDFFVGDLAALTHDNSLPEPELEPFDAVPDLVMKGGRAPTSPIP
jgi:hypothetical protein